MTMLLPTLEDLQHVTSLLWREDFLQLDDMRKLQVVAIAQKGLLTQAVSDVPLNITIGFAETLAEQQPLKKVVEQLEEIDKSLGPIMDWFRESKVYYP